MPKRTSKSGSDLFIIDNSDTDWKALRYLHDWCPLPRAIDVAGGYFEIGALLGLKDEWRNVDQIRIARQTGRQALVSYLDGKLPPVDSRSKDRDARPFGPTGPGYPPHAVWTEPPVPATGGWCRRGAPTPGGGIATQARTGSGAARRRARSSGGGGTPGAARSSAVSAARRASRAGWAVARLGVSAAACGAGWRPSS